MIFFKSLHLNGIACLCIVALPWDFEHHLSFLSVNSYRRLGIFNIYSTNPQFMLFVLVGILFMWTDIMTMASIIKDNI
mgnify:CR=1 FL=1